MTAMVYLFKAVKLSLMSSQNNHKDSVPMWRRATQRISQQVQDLGSEAMKATELLKSGIESGIEEAQRAAEQTLQATQDVAKSAQELASHQVNQAITQAESAVNMVSGHIADKISDVGGDQAGVVSDFVRDGGLMTVAGFAFAPIALARRGIDTYQASQEFMRGEITLGVCLVKFISPSIIDAQEYLRDPDNQTKILDTVHKVFPRELSRQLLAPITQLSGEVVDGVSQAPLSGDALQKFNELMEYRRPSSHEPEVTPSAQQIDDPDAELNVSPESPVDRSPEEDQTPHAQDGSAVDTSIE